MKEGLERDGAIGKRYKRKEDGMARGGKEKVIFLEFPRLAFPFHPKWGGIPTEDIEYILEEIQIGNCGRAVIWPSQPHRLIHKSLFQL